MKVSPVLGNISTDGCQNPEQYDSFGSKIWIFYSLKLKVVKVADRLKESLGIIEFGWKWTSLNNRWQKSGQLGILEYLFGWFE